MVEWRFPSNDHGENKGINESGVSTFRGTPLKSLAREICQNSLDAAFAPSNQPVRVEFKLFSLQTDLLPGGEQLKETYQRCLDFWKSQKSSDTKDYFNLALETIRANECVCLRISDFNTTGLTGSRERINSDWTNLTKSAGASDKKSTAGGSYGIGKYAPFACSNLLTVFYSTYDCHEERAFQGVSRLVTFTRDDGEDTQGIGYYGNEQNTPVFEELRLDQTFKREEREFGTDIYILGYKYGEGNWQRELLVSVLDGFLGALWRGQLSVVIGDLIVEKETLGQLIDEYDASITKYTKYYYKALISEDTHWYSEDFQGYGEVELGIRLFEEPDAPKRIAMVRKTGMKIFDKGNLPGAAPFAGILFINGEKINQRLRAIENPEHTRWEPERAQNTAIAKALVQSLYSYLKTKIEDLINAESGETIDAVGVGAFLPDVDDGDNAEQDETLSDKVFEVEIKPVKAKTIKRERQYEPEGDSEAEEKGNVSRAPDGEDEAWFHKDGHTRVKGPRPGQPAQPGNEEQAKGEVRKLIKPNKVICLCSDRAQGSYILKIVPQRVASNIEVEVFLSAETQKYPAPLKRVSVNGRDAIIENNRIKGLAFIDNKELVLRIDMEYYDYCSLEVLVYAVEE